MVQVLKNGSALAVQYQVQSSFGSFTSPQIQKQWCALMPVLNKTLTEKSNWDSAAGEGNHLNIFRAPEGWLSG